MLDFELSVGEKCVTFPPGILTFGDFLEIFSSMNLEFFVLENRNASFNQT